MNFRKATVASPRTQCCRWFLSSVLGGSNVAAVTCATRHVDLERGRAAPFLVWYAPDGPLPRESPCVARRFLEQQCQEPARVEPQQERPRQPQQQHWLPGCPGRPTTRVWMSTDFRSVCVGVHEWWSGANKSVHVRASSRGRRCTGCSARIALSRMTPIFCCCLIHTDTPR